MYMHRHINKHKHKVATVQNTNNKTDEFEMVVCSEGGYDGRREAYMGGIVA